MTISDKGLALIQQFEGCRLTAYKCPAGVWTIGYGHTGAVDGKPIGKGMKITKAQATELLREDCARFEAHVSKYGPWNQNEFDALVSFAYNVGNINGLTASGKRSRAEIAEAMLRYNKAGGKVLAGLTRRRTEERALFLTPCEEVITVDLKTLKRGSEGSQVKAWQRILRGYGCDTCAVDGDFGPTTDRYTRDWQAKQGLAADGVVGSKSWGKALGVG